MDRGNKFGWRRATISCTAAAVALYVAGFLFLVPIMLSTDGFLREPLHKANKFLYGGWIASLNAGNPIRKLWIENSTYWCEVNSQCELGDPHESKRE